MTSQLPCFRCLFLSCQQQKNIENGAAVTSLRSFLFREDFSTYNLGMWSILVKQLATRPRVCARMMEEGLCWGAYSLT